MTASEAKAKLMRGARNVEAEYTTAAFYVQRLFKLDIKQMNNMPVSTFKVLLEEIEEDYKKQKKEIEKQKPKKR